MKFEIRTELNIVVDDFWMIFDVSLKKRQWTDILQYYQFLHHIKTETSRSWKERKVSGHVSVQRVHFIRSFQVWLLVSKFHTCIINRKTVDCITAYLSLWISAWSWKKPPFNKKNWLSRLCFKLTVLKKGSWIKSNTNLNFTVTETLN